MRAHSLLPARSPASPTRSRRALLTAILMAVVAAIVALVFAAGTAAAQEHDHHRGGPADPPGVGAVRFPVSCDAAAAPRFERAVAMLHSFWFDAALAEFEAVAAEDPSCAMAHWGRAMTLMGNPMTRALPSSERLAEGREAAERAAALADGASPRERGYIDAVAAYYAPVDGGFPARMTAHEEAMDAVRRAHPDDDEAAVFYARAAVANAPPTDLTFARQTAAAELMRPLFERLPEHPGLAHYIIHAYDYPSLADRALEAAIVYADLAPDAPHALHMPSHIFTRLGHWDESIATNERSARAEPEYEAAVHPLDYMVYAYLQQGRDAEARAVLERTVVAPDRFYGTILSYNHVAMRARFALERGDWPAAAALDAPDGADPYIEAIPRFARAIGAARSGDAAAAEAEAGALAELESSLREKGDAYWATVVGAQRRAAEAWLARARGDDAAAVARAREAADLEETVEKHPVTPGPLLPARELLGDLLLELGRAEEALAEYEATLEREPRRARTLFGAARAAEAAGRAETARAHYGELLEVMERADAGRREVEEARRFVGGEM